MKLKLNAFSSRDESSETLASADSASIQLNNAPVSVCTKGDGWNRDLDVETIYEERRKPFSPVLPQTES